MRRLGRRCIGSHLKLAVPFSLLLLGPALCHVTAQEKPSANPAPTAVPPSVWIKEAADRQLRIIDDEGTFPLSYRVRKVDDKDDITRVVIESTGGTVARLIERDGHPLTQAQDDAERSRLNDILLHPEEFRKHQKRNDAVRNYSKDLVHLFPSAMRFHYTAGQPQIPGLGPQVVIDYESDPAFQPPTLISQILTGLAGRIWIDTRSRTLVRSEGHIARPVNFGWGMLIRLYPGGSVVFEQTQLAEDRWVYSFVEDHLRMRQVLVHTAEQNVHMSASDFRLSHTPLDSGEAIHALLAMKIPLQP